MTTDLDDEIRREFVAGPIRQADTVWEIGLRLMLCSDTHIGAASPAAPHAAVSDVDQLVDRDPRTGAPRLRATTLTGLLRHHLADKLGRENGEDPQGVNTLFGRIERRETPGRAEDRPVMSVLDVDDAYGEPPTISDTDGNQTSEGPAVRTGNRVDPRSGAVEAGKLWQMEVLPAGTCFVVTLRLHLRDQRAEPDHNEAELLALLTRATEGLAEDGPGVRLGARAGRGLGAVHAEAFSARRHDLLTPQGWADYYARTWQRRWQQATDALTAHSGGLEQAITGALAEARRAAYRAALTRFADNRHRAELRLTLAVGEQPTDGFLGDGAAPRPGVILLGDLPRGEVRDTEADRAHRMRPTVAQDGAVNDAPMLGDTALFALVKRIGRRLAQDLRGETIVGHDPWLARWWGSEPEQPGEDGSRAPTTARVTLRQAPRIEGGTPLPTTRTTIDALFADTVDGRLFTDHAWAGGTSTFVLDVREPDDAVCALLALIVRELHTVPFDAIGGGAGVGHGRITATGATLLRYGPDRAEPDTLDLLAVLRDPGHERRAEVEGWLVKLKQAVQRDDDTTEAVA